MNPITVTTSIPAVVTTEVVTEGSLSRHSFKVTWNTKDLPARNAATQSTTAETTPAAPLLTLTWSLPIVDIQYVWHPGVRTDRALTADWYAPIRSKLSSGAAIHCFFNDAGINQLTIALDTCLTEVGRNFGVHEENGELICKVEIPLDASGQTDSAEVTLWLDETPERYEDAIRKVTQWWEEKFPPMEVPAAAKRPMYSCWYSLHQDVYADAVLAECKEAAALGLETVIIDDGWQTDDNNRGYGYCGDWQLATKKIPDMAALSQQIHELGMKVMIWYSVPFMGKYSEIAKTFKDKTLFYNEGMNAWHLDPRYPEVREYLIKTYVDAIRDWNLDGLKLDFIDSFEMGPETPIYKEGMDYAVLEDAVHVLMVDVRKALTAVKEDILIEFRQSYIGPVMREFGNMFRVGDCPNSTSTNRIGMVDLRLTSGETAVHTDMLMWHPEDRVENAVCQIENGLFATMQFSAKLAGIKEEHRQAIRFWTQFMKEEQELLQETPIYAESPQMLYPMVSAKKDGRGIYACYQAGYCVTIDTALTDLWVIGANSGKELLLRVDAPARYEMTVYNCLGEPVREEQITLNGIAGIPIPECGLIRLKQLLIQQ